MKLALIAFSSRNQDIPFVKCQRQKPVATLPRFFPPFFPAIFHLGLSPFRKRSLHFQRFVTWYSPSFFHLNGKILLNRRYTEPFSGKSWKGKWRFILKIVQFHISSTQNCLVQYVTVTLTPQTRKISRNYRKACAKKISLLRRIQGFEIFFSIK